MKILKWIAIIIALLAVAFFAVGFMTPELSYENTVKINAPVEKSFSLFMDETTMNEWMPTLKSIENVSGAPQEVGSKWKLIFDQDGEIIELLEVVIAFEPNQRFAFDMDAEPFVGAADIRFHAIDSTTSEITATTIVNGKGIIWKSVLALSKSMMQSQSQEQYEMLKKVIEAN